MSKLFSLSSTVNWTSQLVNTLLITALGHRFALHFARNVPPDISIRFDIATRVRTILQLCSQAAVCPDCKGDAPVFTFGRYENTGQSIFYQLERVGTNGANDVMASGSSEKFPG